MTGLNVCTNRAVLFAALLAAVAASRVVADDNGWRSLFDGKSLDGWEVKSGTATYKVEDGAIVGTTAEGSGNTFLCSKEKFGDFDLTFEVKLDHPQLNSGVQIRSKLKGEAHGGRVTGPQVEIMSSPGHSGYIYGEAFAGWLSPEPTTKGKGGGRHSHFNTTDWNRYRVLAVGPRIQTWINDQPVADLALPDEVYNNFASGLIGLQVHGIAKGTGPYSVRWRNIKIRPMENKSGS